MDLDDALAVLGLDRDTTWAEVRAAYRSHIRVVHPDVGAGSSAEAARLNAAFAALERVYRRGEAPPPPGAPRPRPASPSAPAASPARRSAAPEPPPDLLAVDDDSLVLEAPADEVFHRLAEALEGIGAVTYSDPDGGYLEAVVGEGTGQLVVSLQGRAFATEAFFTLEQIDTRPAPDIEAVVRSIAAQLRIRR
jgi:curved DNA-binding protein CbpA